MTYTGKIIRKKDGTIVFEKNIYGDGKTMGTLGKLGTVEITPEDFLKEIYECLGKTKIEIEIVPI